MTDVLIAYDPFLSEGARAVQQSSAQLLRPLMQALEAYPEQERCEVMLHLSINLLANLVVRAEPEARPAVTDSVVCLLEQAVEKVSAFMARPAGAPN